MITLSVYHVRSCSHKEIIDAILPICTCFGYDGSNNGGMIFVGIVYRFGQQTVYINNTYDAGNSEDSKGDKNGLFHRISNTFCLDDAPDTRRTRD